MPTENNTTSFDLAYKLNDQKPGAEVKGSVFTLTVLRLLSNELADIGNDLRQKIAMGPRFFAHAPVVLDFELLRSNKLQLDFVALVELLRDLSLVPVGVRHATPDQQEAAVAAGLAVVKGGEIRDVPTGPGPKDAKRPMPAETAERPVPREPPHEPPRQPTGQPPLESAAADEASGVSVRTKTIYRPIRSGQRVYAKDGDLIVLAPVNAGAEVVADGNIHIYGPLRGRALAGAHGDLEARIFCQSMSAELVAIAGCYQMLDESVPKELLGRPAQVRRDGDKLHFESVG